MNKGFITAIIISALAHAAALATFVYYNRSSDVPFGDGIVTVEVVGEGEGGGVIAPARRPFGGSPPGSGGRSNPPEDVSLRGAKRRSNLPHTIEDRGLLRHSNEVGIPRNDTPSPPSSPDSANSAISDSTGAETRTGTGLGTGLGAGSPTGNPILTRIRSKIERAKYYPPTARRQKLEGRPEVVFQINPDGSLASAALKKSSGSQILDDAALETIRRAIPLPYYKDFISLAIRFSLE